MSTTAPRRLRPLFFFTLATLLAPCAALATPSTSVKPYGAKSVVPTSVSSLSDDMLLREAKRCTAYFDLMERRTGIPSQLLGSISVAESGRWHDGLNIRIPWPWTINAEGKGQYFTTKAEAIRTVRQLQAKGVKSIDVGCMQVNLMHHKEAFASLDQAFDPYYNISYAAKFLRSHFDETRSWPKAVAYYHSQTPERGGPYAKRVMGYWREHLTRARLLTGNAYSPLLAALPDMDLPVEDEMSDKERAREAALAERRKSKIIVVGSDGKAKSSTLESTSHGVKVVRGSGPTKSVAATQP
ncbi:MAG: lytic transglycosylase domain-containing protein, partial [Alphaproteobacteria bacterium]|nr:lytic transglycosylase domain-containing protein [Alphaproteobacteria bacterium]